MLRLESLEFFVVPPPSPDYLRLCSVDTSLWSFIILLHLHWGFILWWCYMWGPDGVTRSVTYHKSTSRLAWQLMMSVLCLGVRGSLIPVATRASHYLAMGTDIIFYRHLWQAARERFLACWVMRWLFKKGYTHIHHGIWSRHFSICLCICICIWMYLSCYNVLTPDFGRHIRR